MKLLLILCIVFPYEVSLDQLFPIRNYIIPETRSEQPKIFGGVTITNNGTKRSNTFSDFEYMIFIINQRSGERCSGSLIRRNLVLTAAHCLFAPPHRLLFAGGSADMTPIVGTDVGLRSGDIETLFGKKVYIHPSYNETSLAHDLGVVKLSDGFSQSNINPIEIAFDKIREKKCCTLVGWGMSSSGGHYVLRMVENKKISTTSLGCEHKSSGHFICLTNDGSGLCVGDSGSPIVCENKVTGVSSHLFGAADCANSVEEYYVEIAPYEEWIYNITNEEDAGYSIKGMNLWTVLGFNFLIISRHSVGL